MPDDLVEMARLAQHDERMATGALYGDLADRIEKLSNCVAVLEAKLSKSEALLAKAVEIALEECPFAWGTGSYNDWWYDRRTTLAAVSETHKLNYDERSEKKGEDRG